jgi:hypothetical protein
VLLVLDGLVGLYKQKIASTQVKWDYGCCIFPKTDKAVYGNLDKVSLQVVKSDFISLMIRCTVEPQNLSASNDDPAVKKTDSYVCRVCGGGGRLVFSV